jgi:hypothetical protein
MLKPEILCHPHIPKPLHGVAPREIMGKDWWDKTRQEVYASTNYHCACCGVHKSNAKKHKWLEAHEFWNIDYSTGKCTISSIEPLCHYCHNFIHSGRLSVIIGKEKSYTEVKDILQHGFNVLKNKGLKVFEFTYKLAKSMNVDTYDVEYYTIESSVSWDEFHLIWNNQQYKGLTKQQWMLKYSK